MSGEKRAIYFDLSVKKLKTFYPSKRIGGYRKAYKDLEKFFTTNGFEHTQWSGYVSKDKLTKYEVSNIVNTLFNTFPWLKKCVNSFDVTISRKGYSYLDLVDNINEADINIDVSVKKESLNKRLNNAKQTANELNSMSENETGIHTNKDNDITLQ